MLADASENYGTLNKIIDFDNKNDTVKTQGSLSRNLRRVRQGLDLIRALFQNFLSSDDCNLKEAASTAYTKTCAPYHTWAVRNFTNYSFGWICGGLAGNDGCGWLKLEMNDGCGWLKLEMAYVVVWPELLWLFVFCRFSFVGG